MSLHSPSATLSIAFVYYQSPFLSVAYGLDGVGELAVLEQLVTLGLVAVKRGHAVDLSFSHLLGLDVNSIEQTHLRLSNSEKSEEIRII